MRTEFILKSQGGSAHPWRLVITSVVGELFSFTLGKQPGLGEHSGRGMVALRCALEHEFKWHSHDCDVLIGGVRISVLAVNFHNGNASWDTAADWFWGIHLDNALFGVEAPVLPGCDHQFIRSASTYKQWCKKCGEYEDDVV